MTTDKFGRIWSLPKNELCPKCGQPDSCRNCLHKRLTNVEVIRLGGKFSPAVLNSKMISAKSIKRLNINAWSSHVTIEAVVRYGTAIKPGIFYRIEAGDLTEMIRRAGKLKVTQTSRQKYARLEA
jgi:hypothetical protein